MSKRGARGFTLLEVLIAFVIAALALAVMFKVATDSLQESAVSARYEEAVVRAKSHLAMATHGGTLTPGNWSGDDGSGYRWQIQVRPVAQAAASSNSGSQMPVALYSVSVSITWSEGEHTREVRLDTEQIGQPVNNG
jgi:general secretion pathway protein I